LGFTNFDFGEFFGFGDDSNPLMMLIWIIPIIIFIFYGQRIRFAGVGRQFPQRQLLLRPRRPPRLRLCSTLRTIIWTFGHESFGPFFGGG